MAVEEDKSEIIQLVDKLHTAYEQNNFEPIKKLYSTDFKGIGTNKEEIMVDLKDRFRIFNEQHTQQKNEFKVKFDFDQSYLNLIDDAAFCMNSGKASMILAGQEYPMDFRETIVFKKENNKWMIWHSHWSLPIIESETPLPKLDSIAEGLSNMLKLFDLESYNNYFKDQTKREQFIKYLKQAKMLVDNEPKEKN